MSKRPFIDDRIIEKAAEIWANTLHNPKFDNGDNSYNGAIGMAMCRINAVNEQEKLSDLQERVNNFRVRLSEHLKFLRDNDGKPRPEEEIEKDKASGEKWIPETYYLDTYLNCDYHPGALLSKIADECGVPKGLFSIKSSVSLHSDRVVASFGYGAPFKSYYPLSGKRWLVADLSGRDMEYIIEWVEKNGCLPGLEIQDAPKTEEV